MISLGPACGRMIELLHGVPAEALGRPTPCAEYTVMDLIAHVDQVARGFTAMAVDQPEQPAGADPGDGLPERVKALGEAWADEAAWRGTAVIGGGLELPRERWGKIALTEVVVHGWDLAVATGQPFEPDERTLRDCLAHVAEFVPGAPLPELWGPPVPVPADAPTLSRILGITGRTP